MAVGNDQAPGLKTETQKQESFLFLRMIRVVDHAGVFVEKHGLGLLK
jgi:hypothetical protein